VKPLALFVAFFLQSADPRPEFDVASLKPVVLDGSDSYRANLLSIRNGILIQTNVTLADCLRSAYGIPTEDQIAGPAWVKSKAVRFNIEGKAPPDTPRDRELLMLQRLLEDRFQLVLRHEQREMSYLALVTAKGGPKITPTPDPEKPPESKLLGNSIHSTRMDMPLLAYLISRFARTRVLDKTGITGFYQIALDWTPDDAKPDDTPEHPSLYEAVQKQLGLKLEARKGPVDTLLVEKALETPIGN
jgi:uncharacterized protein (TIGR03435 family)